MIVTPLVNVVGNYDVTDDVIFCDLLQFGGLTPQLVIRPLPGAKVGAQRLLKIVAKVIDTTGSTGATITYNLDNNFELPAGNVPSFADPTTPAKAGADGNPSFWQGPIPPANLATPDFSLLNGPGPFPKAPSGGDGAPGGTGDTGAQGLDGPILEIWTTNIIGSFTVDLRGQQGGNGGKGGNGQFGGNGQSGSIAVPGTDTTWLGIPNLVCNQVAGLAGDGGRGGNAGCGGDGGNGGKGGNVKLFYTSGVNPSALTTMLTGGNGGNPGSGGTPGQGGKAGLPGTNLPPCLPTQNSQDGPIGNSCGGNDKTGAFGGPVMGSAGTNGQFGSFMIKSIPTMPGL